jgi:hypothetical protein
LLSGETGCCMEMERETQHGLRIAKLLVLINISTNYFFRPTARSCTTAARRLTSSRALSVPPHPSSLHPLSGIWEAAPAPQPIPFRRRGPPVSLRSRETARPSI